MEYKLPKKPKIKEKVMQPDQRRFCVVPLRAVLAQDLTLTGLKVLCLLASYANKSGFTYVSQARLANDIGVSVQAINRQIKQLEQHGYIKQFDGYSTNIKGKTKRIIYDEDISDREAEQIGGESKEPFTNAEYKMLLKAKRNKDLLDGNQPGIVNQSTHYNIELLARLKTYVSNERESQRLEALINQGESIEKLEAHLLKGLSLRYYIG